MTPTELSKREKSTDTVQHLAEPEVSRCQGDSPSAAAAGGVLSNTPPRSSKWIASVDWLEFCLYVDWRPDKWKELTEKLESCKRYAGMKDAPKEVTGFKVDGSRIDVEPSGAKSGKGRKGIYCAWMF